LISSSFLRHCDETKTLPYSPPKFCLIGADAVQAVWQVWRARTMQGDPLLNDAHNIEIKQ
jgi:hypothetical protein